MSSKLISVERSIGVYDLATGERLYDIVLDIELDHLKRIVAPESDDPLMYEGYELDSKQLNLLIANLEQAIVPNHEKFFYVLQCLGIYD